MIQMVQWSSSCLLLHPPRCTPVIPPYKSLNAPRALLPQIFALTVPCAWNSFAFPSPPLLSNKFLIFHISVQKPLPQESLPWSTVLFRITLALFKKKMCPSHPKLQGFTKWPCQFLPVWPWVSNSLSAAGFSPEDRCKDPWINRVQAFGMLLVSLQVI